MKWRNAWGGLILSVGVVLGGSAQAQIVTFDPTAQAQRITQLSNMVDQIEKLREQYQLQKQQFENLSGATTIGDLLPDEFDDLIDQLPEEWQGVYADLAAHRGDTIGEAALGIYADSMSQIGQDKISAAEGYMRDREQQKFAVDKAMGEQSYNAQLQRIDDLKTFVRKLNQSATAKQVMDLQTRVAVTQATIMAERNKQAAAAILQQAENQQIRAQAREVQRRRLFGGDGDDNSVGDITKYYD